MSLASGISVLPAASAGLTGSSTGVVSPPVNPQSSLGAASEESGVNSSMSTSDERSSSSEVSTWKQALTSAGIAAKVEPQNSIGAAADSKAGEQSALSLLKEAALGTTAQSGQAVRLPSTVTADAKVSSTKLAHSATASESSGSSKSKSHASTDVNSTTNTSAVSQQNAAESNVAITAPNQVLVPTVATPVSGSASSATAVSLGREVKTSAAVPTETGVTGSVPHVFDSRGAVSDATTAGPVRQQELPSVPTTARSDAQSTPATSTGSSEAMHVAEVSSLAGSQVGSATANPKNISGVLGSNSASIARAGQANSSKTASQVSAESTDATPKNVGEFSPKLNTEVAEDVPGSKDASATLQSGGTSSVTSASDAKSPVVGTRLDKNTSTQQTASVQDSSSSALFRTQYQADISTQSLDGSKSSPTGKSDVELNGSTAFSALDSGNNTPPTTWITANPRAVEAGYHDSSLGWVSVRAQSDAAGVHATVMPVSVDAYQSLSSHIGGLSAYLSEHRSSIESVTIDTTNMDSTGQSSGNGAQAQSQQNNNSTDTARSNSSGMDLQVRAERPELNDAASPIALSGGTYISVLA